SRRSRPGAFIVGSRSHEATPDLNDNNCDGDWNVTTCIGKWRRGRMEKWNGLGFDWRINEFNVVDISSSSCHVLHHRYTHRQVHQEKEGSLSCSSRCSKSAIGKSNFNFISLYSS